MTRFLAILATALLAPQLAWAEAILSRMRREAAAAGAATEGEHGPQFDAVLT